jgi:RNA polymerase sigma-70 factor (ECF subfamily)
MSEESVAPSDKIKESKAEDARLVARAKEGDVASFERLFRKYERRIYNLIYRMVGDRENAADLTQDTFVRAFDSLDSVKTGDYFLPWLWRVATNICRDFARRRKRRPTLSLDTKIEDEEGGRMDRQIQDSSTDPALLAEREDLAERMQQAIWLLDEDRRIVVLLHHIEGVDVQEIAQILGIPVGTVKSRLARGRSDLKELLAGLDTL